MPIFHILLMKEGLLMLNKDTLSEFKNEAFNPENKKDLKELTSIIIDRNEPIEQRFEKYINDIGNPYCFLVNGKRVRITYDNDNKTLEKSLDNYITKKINADNTVLMVEYKM